MTTQHKKTVVDVPASATKKEYSIKIFHLHYSRNGGKKHVE